MFASHGKYPLKLRSWAPRSPLPVILIIAAGILLAGCGTATVTDTEATYPPPIVPLTPAIRDDAMRVDFVQLVKDAEMANRAYLKDDNAIKEAYGPNRTFVRTNKRYYGKFFVVRDDTTGQQSIAIRGTASQNDWGDGMDMRKLARVFRDGSRIMFFRGFLEETNNMLPVALEILRPAYHTRIVGHSRGGAMGLILARLLIDNGFDHRRITVVTFGQPKITNRDGVDKYPSINILRVVNDRDLVARFPFHGPIASSNGRYTHIGKALYLWANSEWSLVPDADDRRINKRIIFLRAGEFRIKHHFMKNYLSRLKSLDRDQLVGCCRLEKLQMGEYSGN